jgi:hypothetical protein
LSFPSIAEIPFNGDEETMERIENEKLKYNWL